jgi:prepilin-type N-terminal cleavage/methylation domain-containing protein
VKNQIRSKREQQGYSVVELLVSLAIISIFSAIAVPSLVRSYRSYQMDDMASQVAAEIKVIRYEAVRRNNVMNCLNKPQNGVLTIYGQDPRAANANVQANEKQMVISPNAPAALVAAAAVPSSGTLAAAVNAGALTTVNPANGTITFDGRGAKTLPAGASVYWVGNAAYGWRAVTVLPSGSVQVWSVATGTWKQLS